MAKTLRKMVEMWENDWLKLHEKNLQTESLYMYIAHKTLETYRSDIKVDE